MRVDRVTASSVRQQTYKLKYERRKIMKREAQTNLWGECQILSVRETEWSRTVVEG